MKMPWETAEPVDEVREALVAFRRYIHFLDTYVRIKVTVGGTVKGFFSVLDTGEPLEATTALPDGRVVIFEAVPGAPRTSDPMLTGEQLAILIIQQVRDELL